jgi:hypothetical protein
MNLCRYSDEIKYNERERYVASMGEKIIIEKQEYL